MENTSGGQIVTPEELGIDIAKINALLADSPYFVEYDASSKTLKIYKRSPAS